jgi:hypothetical protein
MPHYNSDGEQQAALVAAVNQQVLPACTWVTSGSLFQSAGHDI